MARDLFLYWTAAELFEWVGSATEDAEVLAQFRAVQTWVAHWCWLVRFMSYHHFDDAYCTDAKKFRMHAVTWIDQMATMFGEKAVKPTMLYVAHTAPYFVFKFLRNYMVVAEGTMEPVETKHREAKKYFMPSLLRFLERDEGSTKSLAARRGALLHMALQLAFQARVQGDGRGCRGAKGLDKGHHSCRPAGIAQATEIDEKIPGRNATDARKKWHELDGDGSAGARRHCS